MGVKNVMKTIIDPVGSLIGFDNSPFFGRKDKDKKEEMPLEEKDEEDKRKRRYKHGGKVKRQYKRGGVVRGAGICKRGIRKAKMY